MRLFGKLFHSDLALNLTTLGPSVTFIGMKWNIMSFVVS
jgi:hypothetical protein